MSLLLVLEFWFVMRSMLTHLKDSRQIRHRWSPLNANCDARCFTQRNLLCPSSRLWPYFMIMKLTSFATIKKIRQWVLRPWITLKDIRTPIPTSPMILVVRMVMAVVVSFPDCSVERNGGNSDRDQGGGRFANFCFKYGYTVNVCHFQSDKSFQLYESLTFFDPSTLQPIPSSNFKPT